MKKKDIQNILTKFSQIHFWYTIILENGNLIYEFLLTLEFNLEKMSHKCKTDIVIPVIPF